METFINLLSLIIKYTEQSTQPLGFGCEDEDELTWFFLSCLFWKLESD